MHRRNYNQIVRSLRRLHRGEIQALRLAGKMLAELQVTKIAILEDRLSRFLAKMMDVMNKNGTDAKELTVWADKVLSDGYVLELEESRLMSTCGALLAGISITTEQTMMQMLNDLLDTKSKKSELHLALDLATARRNARTFTHRAMVSMKTLFAYNDVAEEAAKIVEISSDQAHRMFVAEQAIIEGRLDGDSFFAANASDFDLEEQIRKNGKSTKGIRKNAKFLLKAREGFEVVNKKIQKTFDSEAQHFMLGKANISATEVGIHVTKKSIRATRALADDIEHLAEGEAAYLLSHEQLVSGDVKDAFVNYAIAKRALTRFVSDEPKHFHSGSVRKDNLDDYTEKSEAQLRREYNELLAEQKKFKSRVVQYGKYGHRKSLRGRIFRQGVAVDRVNRLPPQGASRYRLDRLRRALQKKKVYFSVASRRRMKGVTSGERQLAKKVIKAHGALLSPAFPQRGTLNDRNGVNQFAEYKDSYLGARNAAGFADDIKQLIRKAQWLVKVGSGGNVTFAQVKKTIKKNVARQLFVESSLPAISKANLTMAEDYVTHVKKRINSAKLNKEASEKYVHHKTKDYLIDKNAIDTVQKNLVGNTETASEALRDVILGLKAGEGDGVEVASKGLKQLGKLMKGKVGKKFEEVAHNIKFGGYVSTHHLEDRRLKPNDLWSDNRLKDLMEFQDFTVPKIKLDFEDADKSIGKATGDIDDYFENLDLEPHIVKDDDKYDKFEI
jgi:hypothetical protein